MSCSRCKHQNKSKTELPCLECVKNRAVDRFEPMTHADRIRNFTDDELADFLRNLQKIAIDTNVVDEKEYALAYLQSEVEVDTK